jgi:predicted dehydrogenase
MKIRIAISGAGFIADIHAKAAQAHKKDCEIVALVEKFPDISRKYASKFNIPRTYTDLEALLKECEIDALIIGTPNFLHAPQSIAALQAGVAVMVEKPMAMNSQEAQMMLNASKQTGAILMVAHCWRFDKEINWLREQVKSGKLGKIVRTKGYGVHTNWGPSGWFTKKEIAGGGALADMGIHALDTTRYLQGDPQPISVYAHIGTFYQDFDVDDTGIIIVNWDNGSVSYIEFGWWQPHMDGPEASTQLYGTQAFGSVFPTRLEIPDPAKQRIKKVKGGFPYPRKEHCPQEMYNDQLAYFIKCIRTKKTPVPGGLEGLVNMKIIDAAYESASMGRVVEIH